MPTYWVIEPCDLCGTLRAVYPCEGDSYRSGWTHRDPPPRARAVEVTQEEAALRVLAGEEVCSSRGNVPKKPRSRGRCKYAAVYRP